MLAFLFPTLILVASFNDPQLSADQLRDLIRVKMAPVKSLIYVYEGQSRWVGDARLIKDTGQFAEEFQGTFLYRRDGAAFYDLYTTNPTRGGGVIRRRSSLLKGQIESTQDILDAKHRIGADDIRVFPGFLTSFSALNSPLDLQPIWGLEGVYDVNFHEVVVEGWESLDDRNCLRVSASVLIKDQDTDKERDKRFYWLDMERNAQVLKMEYHGYGKLKSRIDDVRLAEHRLPDGSSYWLPVHSRKQWFVIGDNFTKEPVIERTLSVVAGTERLNLDLPDSLFNVKREVAWPATKELERVDATVRSGPLARKFQTQEPPPPYRTDPVSVRQRIEANLAEADRQSKELEASSPTRQAWSGTTLVQIGVGLLGVALLGGVAARKWRMG